MLTLGNFDKQISSSVLNRGRQYYKDGAVIEIEEINDGFWNAEVEGPEFYEVGVQLNGNDAIIDSSCTEILALAPKLKSKYPCRPAMVEELNGLASDGQKKYH